MRPPKCLRCGGEHWSREGCAKAAIAPLKFQGVEIVFDKPTASKEIGADLGRQAALSASGGAIPAATKREDAVAAPVDHNAQSSRAPRRGKGQKIPLSAKADDLRLELERLTGMKVRLLDTDKTRTYNREYMRKQRRSGKTEKGVAP